MVKAKLAQILLSNFPRLQPDIVVVNSDFKTRDIAEEAEPKPLRDLERDRVQDEQWDEFDRLGEAEIRDRISRKSYDGQSVLLARQWLANREYLHVLETIRMFRATTNQSKDIARDANRTALEASDLATAAKSTAHMASETADLALSQSRGNAMMARLAIVVAVMATAISVAQILYR